MAAEELAGRIGQTAEACEALGVARSTLYRRRQPVTPKPKRRPRPHRALDETEREEVLGALHCERFVDKAPAQVWATLLDEGTYLCSIRTMYRILEEHGEVRERRNQRRHPNYTKPELLAEAPNQVWSWDITKLRGPVKWTYYYLYVILDIFSRYVVGWMLAHRESAALAQRLIAESCRKQVSVRSDHVAESRKAIEPWCIPPEERSTKEARDGDRQKRGDIEIIGKAALVGVGCAGGGVGMAT